MEFNRNGIHFEYPDNWAIEEDTSPDGAYGITVSAPDGAFWSLSRQPPVQIRNISLMRRATNYAENTQILRCTLDPMIFSEQAFLALISTFHILI